MKHLSRSEARRLEVEGGLGNFNTALIPSRTRGGGNGRPDLVNMIRKKKMLTIDLESSDDSTVSGGEDSEDDATPNMMPVAKPSHSRVILEVGQIEKAFEQLCCPQCKGPIEVSLRTVCIASSIGFSCKDDNCGYLFHAEQPAPTTIHDESNDKYERSTDYAINVLYVLGFIAVGDGCTEAARLLGLLGLPNDTTMESRSFTIIEDRLGPLIREICNEILLMNLTEEAKLAMEASETHDEHDFKTWKDSLTDKSIKLSLAKMPKIEASYDMAWQQKGSDHVYNSLSGHGTFIGMHSRKVIALVVKSKTCGICTAF